MGWVCAQPETNLTSLGGRQVDLPLIVENLESSQSWFGSTVVDF